MIREENGGSVWVESEEKDKETTFIVRLNQIN